MVLVEFGTIKVAGRGRQHHCPCCPLVVSSVRADCDRIDGDGDVSSSSPCCCRELCDPNELADCSCVPWYTLSDDKECEVCTHEVLFLGSGDVTYPLDDLACTDIAAAAEYHDDTETDGPGLSSSIQYACAPQRPEAQSCRSHQRRASRTYGFPGCPALPHSHRRRTSRLGARHQCRGDSGIHPRTSWTLDGDARPMGAVCASTSKR